ncbi:hypothetical protein E2562_022527 [Oryza meyeriana var. granulata]|uniref:Xylanase inhibitor N-terminal domain-containing protein n=1 Tax=Oryza meyeriana var. granulata TaxID=110450 RepID=A0A6G1FB02_9ORYZ|nr:hypothetical protein E2562_022527 [Oryza meyeriana var. granulata]
MCGQDRDLTRAEPSASASGAAPPPYGWEYTGAASQWSDFVYTPMLHNPKHPYFYLVALEAVSVGGTRIKDQPELGYVNHDGNGGMVLDSGTMFAS